MVTPHLAPNEPTTNQPTRFLPQELKRLETSPATQHGAHACLAVATDQAQTEPGDARDVALHPPSSLGHSHGAHIQPLLVASHSNKKPLLAEKKTNVATDQSD